MTPAEKKINAFEALLFVYGEPLPVKKAAKLLDIQEADMEELIEKLKARLKESGLTLITHNLSIQLATKPEFGDILEKVVKEDLKEELTAAALETLAIVCYLGPIQRSRIDFIRGVNSSFMLRNLLLRGLVDRSPDPQKANVFLYQASFNLVRHFGLETLEQLPEFSKYRELLKTFSANE